MRIKLAAIILLATISSAFCMEQSIRETYSKEDEERISRLELITIQDLEKLLSELSKKGNDEELRDFAESITDGFFRRTGPLNRT